MSVTEPPAVITPQLKAPARPPAAPAQSEPVRPLFDNGDCEKGSAGSPVAEQSLTFEDFLDLINPLQHIPVVSTVYRAITGDTISPVARVAGGAILGGPMGALLAGLAAAADEALSGGPAGQAAAQTSIAAVSDSGPAEIAENIEIERPIISTPPLPDTASSGSASAVGNTGSAGEASKRDAASPVTHAAAVAQPEPIASTGGPAEAVGRPTTAQGAVTRSGKPAASGMGIRDYIANARPEPIRPAAKEAAVAASSNVANQAQVASAAMPVATTKPVHAGSFAATASSQPASVPVPALRSAPASRDLPELPSWFHERVMQGMEKYRAGANGRMVDTQS